MKVFAPRERTEDGASAVEYGLLVVAIAAVITVIVFAIGGMVSQIFTDTCNKVDSGSFSHTATCS